MVTTRSADKQASAKSKPENLALRSKPSDTEDAALNSSKKKSNVLVNVPPPRKRTRLSYNGADDKLEDSVVISVSDTTRTEIPDSQESPLKPTLAKGFHAQAEFNVTDIDEPVSSTQTNTKRKRKLDSPAQTPSTRKSVSKSTPDAKNKHKRFGSEDPADSRSLASDEDKDGQQTVEANHVQTDDESDAPEIATTKNVATSASSQRKRKTGPKRSAPSPANSQPISIDTAPDEITSIETGMRRDDSPKVDVTPALKVNTKQDSRLDDDLASENSSDTAFVTARPYRHFDAFETPQSNSLHVEAHHDNDDSLAATPNDHKDEAVPSPPVRNASSNLDILEVSRVKPTPVASASSSTTLPRKAGNSLDGYRQQLLQNRAGANGKRFKLQSEWSGRRRKFVVGY